MARCRALPHPWRNASTPQKRVPLNTSQQNLTNCGLSKLFLQWFQPSLYPRRELSSKLCYFSSVQYVAGKIIKVMSNVTHVAFHSIRQNLAHTHDTEINWCNGKNVCLEIVRGEYPPLQFQTLYLAWHVMWSQFSLRKTNPFSPLFYIQACSICSYFRR